MHNCVCAECVCSSNTQDKYPHIKYKQETLPCYSLCLFIFFLLFPLHSIALLKLLPQQTCRPSCSPASWWLPINTFTLPPVPLSRACHLHWFSAHVACFSTCFNHQTPFSTPPWEQCNPRAATCALIPITKHHHPNTSPSLPKHCPSASRPPWGQTVRRKGRTFFICSLSVTS